MATRSDKRPNLEHTLGTFMAPAHSLLRQRLLPTPIGIELPAIRPAQAGQDCRRVGGNPAVGLAVCYFQLPTMIFPPAFPFRVNG